MNDIVAKRRWFRFSLRTLLILVALVAIITAFLVRSWHRTQLRYEYTSHAGAVDGHVRTMQGYRFRVNRWRVSGLLFGDQHVETIKLYPGSYDDAELAKIRELFPEAKITEYRRGD
jgi:hypothetical protein